MNSDFKKQAHLLFTPGPLSTSRSVKRAMLEDLGSREPRFVDVVREIRTQLLEIAGVSTGAGYEAVPLQGSGTYAIESVIGSVIPRDGKLLVLVNGAYGRRMIQIAGCLGISVTALEFEETESPDPGKVEAMLDSDPTISHVAVVHCETTTGILNPIQAIAEIVERHGRKLIVDAMSSFGGIPIDLSCTPIDFLVSSANKCLEGVPGFAFVLARRTLLESARGRARSVSLDLAAQWEGLETNGQFRFTPPTHALLAFRRALTELDDEGGVDARYLRYRKNSDTLVSGMEQLGFDCLLPPALRSPVITTFVEPQNPAFEFDSFYRGLADQHLIIYPGKVSRAPSFRIGTIGKIDSHDVGRLLDAIHDSLAAMASAAVG